MFAARTIFPSHKTKYCMRLLIKCLAMLANSWRIRWFITIHYVQIPFHFFILNLRILDITASNLIFDTTRSNFGHDGVKFLIPQKPESCWSQQLDFFKVKKIAWGMSYLSFLLPRILKSPVHFCTYFYARFFERTIDMKVTEKCKDNNKQTHRPDV
jgi:hypothetical protein